MAHQARAHYFDYLIEKLGDVPFSIDSIENRYGMWGNCRRAWQLADPGSDYHVVIQDDAIIGRDFYANVKTQIEARPGHAFSFYFGNRKNMYALVNLGLQSGGLSLNWLSWGVAVGLPTKRIPEMIKFCDNLPHRYYNHDDTMIAKWLQWAGIPVWYPLPSLVDHRTGPSLIGEGTKQGRKAFKFKGE